MPGTAQTRPTPPYLTALFLLLLAAQIAWRAVQPAPVARADALDAPLPAPVLRAASLDEPVPLAGLLALRLQAFDDQPGVSVPFAALDYGRVTAWLATLLELDPQADYPLLMASHIYSQVPDPAKQRTVLDFTYRAFFADPDRRWRWLAHAAVIAKHQLHDLPLALKYARAVAEHAHGANVPHWARQMPIFILEDMGELEAAKVELGALLATGSITDPQEKHFLTERYLELEDRLTKNRRQR
jgi:hypothetical protein